GTRSEGNRSGILLARELGNPVTLTAGIAAAVAPGVRWPGCGGGPDGARTAHPGWERSWRTSWRSPWPGGRTPVTTHGGGRTTVLTPEPPAHQVSAGYIPDFCVSRIGPHQPWPVNPPQEK